MVLAVVLVLLAPACTPTQIGTAQFRDVPRGTTISACIIKRESGGDPSAISPTRDYGLFQINRSAHKANFERMFGGPFERKALDPTLNAKYARYLYNYYAQRGMSGWTPWRGGRYSCGF